MQNVVVIGGGAAGLLAAGTAIRHGATVTVIEHMPRVARKVMITGKGRCNVTNSCTKEELLAAVTKNGRFLYSAFSAFDSSDTAELFEALGVPLKTERGNRVFPKSDKAADIVDALKKYAKGAKILQANAKEILKENGRVSGVLCDDGTTVNADCVIVATGGCSYPLTGSTGDGYILAKKLGHTVTNIEGSLVPLVAKEGFCSVLQGLSLKNVRFTVFKSGAKKPVFSEFGEMIFTHFGISGPLVLSASAHMPMHLGEQYRATIDLKPALSNEELDARLLRDFKKYSSRDFLNSLDDLLPKRLIGVIVKLSGIEPHKKVNEITREERRKTVQLLKCLPLSIEGKRPVEEAIVTSGGINVKEIDPKDMQSKIVKGLYFAGEVIDVDAYTGGFNLQIAFSTGYLAGISAATDEE